MPENRYESLKQKALNGVFWSYFNKFGTQIIAIVPSMVLARYISPNDFGLVAFAAIFSGVAYILSDGGFGNALYQKKDADSIDFSTVFYFNIVICSITYGVFFTLAPLCAEYLKTPEVTNIMRISLLNLIFGAISNTHSLLLRKELKFKEIAKRNLLVQIVTSIIAICLAIFEFGYWTLVFQGLIQTILGGITNWCMVPWRPSISEFSFIRLKSMFGFGSKLYATMLIDYAFSKSYDFIIGKFYSASALSFYNRAFSTANLFIDSFVGVINSVAFPTFAQIQDDKALTRISTIKFMNITCMVVFSIISIAFFLSQPLFYFLYSSKWDAVIPLFRIACIWGLFKPICTVLGNIVMANGRASAFLINSITNKVLIVISIAFTWRLGIEYFVASQIFVILSETLVMSFFTKRVIDYGISEIAKDCLPYILISIVSGSISDIIDVCVSKIIVHLYLPEIFENLIRLLISGSIGVVLIVCINKHFKTSGYSYLLDLLSSSNNRLFLFIKKMLS